VVPMDESLALAAVDLVRRAHAPTTGRVEGVAAEDLHHFLWSLAMNIPAVVHVKVLRGINAHHKVEGPALELGRRRLRGVGGG
jgi:imidazoleglycerol-phosphate dehydratase